MTILEAEATDAKKATLSSMRARNTVDLLPKIRSKPLFRTSYWKRHAGQSSTAARTGKSADGKIFVSHIDEPSVSGKANGEKLHCRQ